MFFTYKHLHYSLDGNRKLIGNVYFTRTGMPLCIPGFQLGIVLTSMIAYFSISGFRERTTVMSDKEPSVLTINCNITIPFLPLFRAASG